MIRKRMSAHVCRKPGRGFTLIELMIVVAIIGVLAAIAVPKFAELVRKSQEGSSRGNLGRLRSALSIYYADMEGEFPKDLRALTQAGKYLTSIPTAKTPRYHADSNTIWNESTKQSQEDDRGGWQYDDRQTASTFGNLFINCSHTDTKGKRWTEY